MDCTIVGRTTTVTIPRYFPVAAFDLIRLQAIYADPNSAFFGLMATNEYWFVPNPCCPSGTVEAVGPNSWTDRGFWRVQHNWGPSVASVELDFARSANPNHRGIDFDTDQGPARFDGGNSTMRACQGSYQGTDTATGLIYGGTQVSTCDPSAQTGWIATNPGAVPNNWRTLSFSFAPRMFAVDRFVFDIDTDGTTTGPQSGGDMKGLMVTIRLADDSVHSGVLVADPHNSERSRWSWVW